MKTGCHLDKGHKCIRQNVHVSADLAVGAEGKKDNVIIEGLLKENIERKNGSHSHIGIS